MEPRQRKRILMLAGGVAFGVAVMFIALRPAPASAMFFGLPIVNSLGLLGDAIDTGVDTASGFVVDGFKAALEWLLGGLQATITLALVKFLVHIELPIGGSLYRATGPMVAIGGFFLIVGLITSIGDGFREIAAGTDTGPRVIGQVVFRVIGLAFLLGCWYWIVPLAVDVANGLSSYVLGDKEVHSALRRSFISSGGGDLPNPLVMLMAGVAVVFTLFTMIVLKFVMTIAFACVYVGGPAAIGFAALPRVGMMPLALVTRGLFTLTIIPLLWSVVFVAWAGVSAGWADVVGGDDKAPAGGVGAWGALMGPCLFLAGLIVILAVTKKAMSMATFGLQLSVPGASTARLAAGVGIYQGLRNAMASAALSRAGGAAASGGGGAGGGSGGSPAQGPQSPNPPRGGGASGGSPAKSGYRRLLDVASGADVINRNRDFQDARQAASEQRAADRQTAAEQRSVDRQSASEQRGVDRQQDRDELTSRKEEDRYAYQRRAATQEDQVRQERQGAAQRHREFMSREDSLAIAGTRNGVYAHRTARPSGGGDDEDGEGTRQMPTMAAASNVTAADLKEAQKSLPRADRSAAATLAEASITGNPGNPDEARAQFRTRMVDEYEGLSMTDAQQKAVSVVLGAEPKDVQKAFSSDRAHFQAEPGVQGHVHDPALFNRQLPDPAELYRQTHWQGDDESEGK